MVDNNVNQGENQSAVPASSSDTPQPIYETVPVEEVSVPVQGDLKPEELAPEVLTPEEVGTGQQLVPEVPASDQQILPPANNKPKFIFMGVAVLLFVFFFVIVLALIPKGGARPPAKKEDIKLLYWGLWEDEDTMGEIIKEYEANNTGIKISYEKKTPEDYRQKLIYRIANDKDTANPPPDIFRFHNTWLPMIKDIVAPISEKAMTNAVYEQTFYPIAQRDLKMGDRYYGIPMMIDGLVLVYNESLFKKAGISTAPANWDELIADAGKVQVADKDGNLITAGAAIGTASNTDHFAEIFGLMLMLNGGEMTKLDAKEAVDALEAYRRFAEPPNNTWSEAMPNAVNAFIQQKVAMIIVPSWELLSIRAQNMDLKMKVVPIPKPPGGKQVSLTTYWAEGVSAKSKHQEEAWKFVKYLSEPKTLTKLYELSSRKRLFGEPYSRVDMANLLIDDPYLGAVIRQAQDDAYVTLPLVSGTFDGQGGLNDDIIRYIENAINQTIQGGSYADALSPAKKGIDQILERYKIQ